MLGANVTNKLFDIVQIWGKLVLLQSAPDNHIATNFTQTTTALYRATHKMS